MRIDLGFIFDGKFVEARGFSRKPRREVAEQDLKYFDGRIYGRKVLEAGRGTGVQEYCFSEGWLRVVEFLDVVWKLLWEERFLILVK